MEGAPAQYDILRPEDLDAMQHQELAAALNAAEQNRSLIEGLDPHVQEAVRQMGNTYLTQGQFTSLRKLFANAVPYVVEGKVQQGVLSSSFVVEGKHDFHIATEAADSSWACDCHLFNGTGPFTGQASECSHIQASQLFILAEAERQFNET
jgi:hypothetical protein